MLSLLRSTTWLLFLISFSFKIQVCSVVKCESLLCLDVWFGLVWFVAQQCGVINC